MGDTTTDVNNFDLPGASNNPVNTQPVPFFEDGLIANAVNDVAALGVSYFCAAFNDIGTYGYDSDYRNIPDGPGALDGTNINLTGVPTHLYQGGFHNFNPNLGQQDVAQTVNVLAAVDPANFFQWNDPYNQVLKFNPDPIFTATGVYTIIVTNFGHTMGAFTVNLPDRRRTLVGSRLVQRLNLRLDESPQH